MTRLTLTRHNRLVRTPTVSALSAGHTRPIVNYYRCASCFNLGDAFASPLRYFVFPGEVIFRDIHDTARQTILGDLQYNIIVGGGGILLPQWHHKIEMLADRHRAKLVFWGGGVNEHHKKSSALPEHLQSFDLVGVRDFGLGYEWVPCPSCMHPAFDKPREITRPVVVYHHHQFPVPLNCFPSACNCNQDFEGVLDLLGSAEAIVTSSYHGAYWGILLGRKVAAFPFSSKFHYLKHQIPLCSPSSWAGALRSAPVYGEALAECRAANMRFSMQVRDLFYAS